MAAGCAKVRRDQPGPIDLCAPGSPLGLEVVADHDMEDEAGGEAVDVPARIFCIGKGREKPLEDNMCKIIEGKIEVFPCAFAKDPQTLLSAVLAGVSGRELRNR